MKEKTITELWVEQAKSRGKYKIKITEPIVFISENSYDYDFSFGRNCYSGVKEVIIFCHSKNCSKDNQFEELGYSFEIKDKQVIWKHIQNAEAYFPDDLKTYIEKYILENEIVFE